MTWFFITKQIQYFDVEFDERVESFVQRLTRENHAKLPEEPFGESWNNQQQKNQWTMIQWLIGRELPNPSFLSPQVLLPPMKTPWWFDCRQHRSITDINTMKLFSEWSRSASIFKAGVANIFLWLDTSLLQVFSSILIDISSIESLLHVQHSSTRFDSLKKHCFIQNRLHSAGYLLFCFPIKTIQIHVVAAVNVHGQLYTRNYSRLFY